jgi:hypothetical protein
MTPDYLAGLRTGNIGVALGKVSGGLCAVDFDIDEYADAFLALNPGLGGTLQTRGNRGRVFWVRFKGQYPQKPTELKSHEGEPIGEFRTTGNQSIVWGTHPDSGQWYRFVLKAPAAVLDFSTLRWPTKIANPPTLRTEGKGYTCRIKPSATLSSGCTSVTHVGARSTNSCTSVTQSETPNTSVTLSVGLGPQTLEQVLGLSQPTQIRTNNDCLFTLARGLINLERKRGHPFQESENDAIFNQWLKRARPFLRPGRSDSCYLEEFRRQRREAKYPIGGDTLVNAWRLANDRALPPEAAKFKSERMQVLVALCFHLHVAHDGEPFFLSPHDIKKLFELPNAVLPDRWMKRLCQPDVHVLELVEKGSWNGGVNPRASRYRYVGESARMADCSPSVTHADNSSGPEAASEVVETSADNESAHSMNTIPT